MHKVARLEAPPSTPKRGSISSVGRGLTGLSNLSRERSGSQDSISSVASSTSSISRSRVRLGTKTLNTSGSASPSTTQVLAAWLPPYALYVSHVSQQTHQPMCCPLHPHCHILTYIHFNLSKISTRNLFKLKVLYSITGITRLPWALSCDSFWHALKISATHLLFMFFILSLFCFTFLSCEQILIYWILQSSFLCFKLN